MAEGMTRSQSEWAFHRFLNELSYSDSSPTTNAVERSPPPVQSLSRLEETVNETAGFLRMIKGIGIVLCRLIRWIQLGLILTSTMRFLRASSRGGGYGDVGLEKTEEIWLQICAAHGGLLSLLPLELFRERKSIKSDILKLWNPIDGWIHRSGVDEAWVSLFWAMFSLLGM